MDFDFITDLEITEPIKETKQSRVREIIPIKGDFRILRNGNILFEPEFGVSLLNNGTKKGTPIEYKWLDFVFSKDWFQYPKEQTKVCFLHINPFGKAFKADVKGQGSSSYIKNYFLEKSRELWGINWNETKYVDFKVEDVELFVKIMHMPKIVLRGKDKGKPSYVIRENVTLFPISPTTDFEVMPIPEPRINTDLEEIPVEKNITPSSIKNEDGYDDIRKDM